MQAGGLREPTIAHVLQHLERHPRVEAGVVEQQLFAVAFLQFYDAVLFGFVHFYAAHAQHAFA